MDSEHIYVIETDGTIHKMIFVGDCDWEEKTTTSITAIRNQVIDEFAKKMNEWLDNDTNWFPENWIFKDLVEEISEQLKSN